MEKIKKQLNFYAKVAQIRIMFFTNKLVILLVYNEAYFNTNDLDFAISSDTIQKRSNSDFDIKYATIQFYGNIHNVQSDRWIALTFYVKSPDMFS